MFRPRLEAQELLDGPVHDPEELAQSLRQVGDVNRWLGGVRGLERRLRRLREPGRKVRLLDVGTGDGWIPRHFRRRAARAGCDWFVTGVDLHPQIARLARKGGSDLHIVRGTALSLPFADACFDVVLCTLTLHHFGEDDALILLGEMRRVSKDLVLVSDLERGRVSYLGARLLAATAWRRNRLTRHDGPISVLRSFTSDELLHLGRSAGLHQPTVRRDLFFRLLLEGRAYR